jgi:hypothetical protein
MTPSHFLPKTEPGARVGVRICGRNCEFCACDDGTVDSLSELTPSKKPSRVIPSPHSAGGRERDLTKPRQLLGSRQEGDGAMQHSRSRLRPRQSNRIVRSRPRPPSANEVGMTPSIFLRSSLTPRDFRYSNSSPTIQRRFTIQLTRPAVFYQQPTTKDRQLTYVWPR